MSIDVDVAIIGAGPTGLTAAALLARNGHRVVVLERQPVKYALPRAGHVDHEVVRILQRIDAAQPLFDDAPEGEAYTWYNGDGRVLLSFPFGEPSISGYQSDFMMFQPVLDDALYAAIDRHPDNAAVQLGAEVIGVEQTDATVRLSVMKTARGEDGVRRRTGEEFAVEATWVIAADGAGSSIRGMLGVARSGPVVDERWYTVDLTVKTPLPAGINGQWCDPRRPIYIGPLGRHHHRFEMKVLPGEDEGLFDEVFTWNLIGTWGVTPAHVDIFRRVIYRFEAQEAERWRVGRVFLAGDAAHTMPPYMGQGLCSGIRDSANLAWKLDLVLRGVGAEGLLDTYESEREPHVRRWREITMAVGAVSAETDPEKAAERDAAFFAGTHPPVPGPPSVGPGVFRNQHGVTVIEPSGTLFPQGVVEAQGRRGLLHDLDAADVIVFVRSDADAAAISDESRVALDALRGTVLALGEGSTPGSILDVSGTYADHLDRLGAVAALVRPDHYLYGTAATPGEINHLIRDFSRTTLSTRRVAGPPTRTPATKE